MSPPKTDGRTSRPGRKPKGPVSTPEWLDRHPRLGPICLVLLPFLVQLPGVLTRGRINPMWQFSWLANNVEPGLLPGHPYLDPNVGFTTQALGHLAAWDWLHGIIPWWNPYVGVGVPLAGEMQPGAFFLPFVLLLILPSGVLWLTIAMQIIGGLATHALLRALRLTRLASLLGGALVALNGTIAWMPGPVSVFCSLPFLPVILWGIEAAFDEDAAPAARARRGAASILAVAAGIAWSILAGFPETAYLNGLLALAWALCRFAQGPRRLGFALRVGGGGLLGLMLASPLLIAFAAALLASDAVGTHTFGQASLKLETLVAWLFPAGLGPPNSASGAAVAFWGDIGGYGTALVAFLAVLQLCFRSRALGLRLLLTAWVALCLCKTYGVQPVADLMNHIPALDQVAFYRYAPPSWEFALVVLATFGFDDLRRGALRAPLAVSTPAVIAAACAAIALAAPWRWPADRFLWLVLSVAWTALALVLFLLACGRLSASRRRMAVAGLVVADAAAMFVLPQLTAGQGGAMDFGPVDYLKAHAGFSRTVSLGPLMPNYASYFRIAGLNHNEVPIPRRWVEHVDRRLFPGFAGQSNGIVFWPAFESPFDRQGAKMALIDHAADYRDMGVRYIIAEHGADLRPSLESPDPSGENRPFDLGPGQTLDAHVDRLASAKDEVVTQAGVLIGTYAGQSDGALALRICVAGQCREGSRALSEAGDNEIFYVDLDGPLGVPAGAALDLDMRHEGGTRPVAVWVWPKAGGSVQVTGPAGAVPAALRLGFGMTAGVPGLRRVFTGDVADIWELDGAASYLDTEPPGACTLAARDRETVSADCTSDAVLIRREFLMPGWSVTLDERPAALTPHGDLFQAVEVPAGRSEVRFRFAPPYVAYGWVASLASLLIVAFLGARLVWPRAR